MIKRITLVAMCLGLFLAQTDTTAVNLALPSIGRDLRGSLADLQWVMDAYNVTFAALLLTGGTLGDRFGRRRLFRCGIATFAAGSALCAAAPGLAALVTGRALQGAGAALTIPQSLAILSVVFPQGRERDRAMAAWSAVTGIALASGPILGGLLVQVTGWQAIFWLNLPIGAAALALSMAVPESAGRQARRVDVGGQVLAIAFLTALTYAIVETGRSGWASPRVAVATAIGVACLAAFVAVERRPGPMLPLGLLRRGPLPIAAVVALCMTFGAYGELLLAGLVLQRHAGALVAGFQLLPQPLMIMAGSPVAGRLATRFGPRRPMTAGMTLLGAGLLTLAVAGADAPVPVVELGFAVTGLGIGFNAGPVMGVAVSAVPPDRAGLAGGVANLARMAGVGFGVAVMGAVFAGHGYRAALLAGTAVVALGAAAAWRVPRAQRRNAAATETAGFDELEPSNSTEKARSSR
ncbi:MFS transporter [Amycolatopsis pigmentata]|uniref:MFS transporter n=1 Tax=Amycolatopsis pigmentata TaxID=450801 RepID=A0ABW5GA04_9PSEU